MNSQAAKRSTIILNKQNKILGKNCPYRQNCILFLICQQPKIKLPKLFCWYFFKVYFCVLKSRVNYLLEVIGVSRIKSERHSKKNLCQSKKKYCHTFLFKYFFKNIFLPKRKMTGAWRVRFSDRGRSRFTPIISRVNRVLEQFSPRRRTRGDPRNRPPTPSRRRRRTVSDSSNNVSS